MSDGVALAGGASLGAEASAIEGDILGVTDAGIGTTGGEQLDASVEDASTSQELNEQFERPKREPKRFNIAIIIAAALIFIVVIAWFESIRIWLEYAFNSSTTALFRKAIGDTIYAVTATVISIFLIFLLVKFWIK